MIPKEIFQKVKQIEITTGRLVNDVFAGEYSSVFKGRGMEFSEVREYVPGDDIRTIDWHVTARTGHPYVKTFVEERELTVIIVADISASGHFGSVHKMKSEIAAEISAVLSFSAIKNNDKVGLILFSDKIEKFIPPKKGRRHVLRVIRELLYFKADNKKTDINCALEYIGKVITRRAVVFFISDFISEDFEKLLRIINKKHDLVALTIKDPREVEMPNVGIIKLKDPETEEEVFLNTGDEKIRKHFYEANLLYNQKTEQLFKSTNVDYVNISTDKSYIKPLITFFKERAKKFR